MAKTQQEFNSFSEKKDGNEKKENTPKKKSSSSSAKKTNKTNKKATTSENENEKKNQSKKHKLTQDIVSSDSDDENLSDSDDENLSLDESSDKETKFSPASLTKSNNELDDDDEDHRPISRKREGGKNDENDEPTLKKRKIKKEYRQIHNDNDDGDDLPYGWDPRRETSTKNINFKTWQMGHSTREMYFFGPDNYLYPNPSTMKKFIDAIQKKEIDEAMVNTAVMPMKKIVGTNPPMSIGITGLRYLSGGGTFNVTPQIYIAKAYQNENNQVSGFKLIKIHMPLNCLDNVREAFNQLSTYLEERGIKTRQ